MLCFSFGLSGSSYLFFMCHYARVRAHVYACNTYTITIIIIVVLYYPDVYFCVYYGVLCYYLVM